MKTKNMLFIAEVFFKTIGILIVLSTLFFLFVFVHSELSPESYNKVTVKIQHVLVINYDPKAPLPPASFAEHKENNNKNIYLGKLNFSSRRRIFFRILVGFLLSLLILKEFLNFINSVKKYSTFFICNYLYFNIEICWVKRDNMS